MSESKNCFALMPVDSKNGGTSQKVCIPEDIYREALNSNKIKCFVVDGKWKDASWFPSFDRKKKQKINNLRIFKIKKILTQYDQPHEGEILGSITFLRKKLAHHRLQWIDFYRKHDSLGIASELFFNFKKSNEADARNQLVRYIGFVHLLNYNGVILHLLFILYSRFFLIFLRCFIQNSGLIEGLSSFCSVLLVGYFWLLAGAPQSVYRPLSYGFLKKLHFNGVKISSEVSLLSVFLFEFILKKGELHEAVWHYYLAVGGVVLFKRSLYLSSWVLNSVYEIFTLNYTIPATVFLNVATGYTLVLIGIPLFTVFHLLNIEPLFLIRLWNFLFTQFIWGASFLIPPIQVKITLEEGLFLLGFSGVFILFLRVKRHLIYLVVLFSLLLRLSLWVWPGVPDESIQQLDVGQGDALWVQKEQRNGWVDVGSSFAIKPHQWFRFVLSAGRSGHPPFVFLTHLDEDHSGGLKNILRVVRPACIEMSKAQWLSQSGQVLWQELEDLRIERVVLGEGHCSGLRSASTQSESCNGLFPKANCLMSGVRIDIGNVSYFNLGDASFDLELALLEKLGVLVGNRNILKWSHHGSKTSGSKHFLDILNPIEIWLTYGCQNRYGHPHEKTLILASQTKAKIRDTCLEGVID